MNIKYDASSIMYIGIHIPVENLHKSGVPADKDRKQLELLINIKKGTLLNFPQGFVADIWYKSSEGQPITYTFYDENRNIIKKIKTAYIPMFLNPSFCITSGSYIAIAVNESGVIDRWNTNIDSIEYMLNKYPDISSLTSSSDRRANDSYDDPPVFEYRECFKYGCSLNFQGKVWVPLSPCHAVTTKEERYTQMFGCDYQEDVDNEYDRYKELIDVYWRVIDRQAQHVDQTCDWGNIDEICNAFTGARLYPDYDNKPRDDHQDQHQQSLLTSSLPIPSSSSPENNEDREKEFLNELHLLLTKYDAEIDIENMIDIFDNINIK